MCSWVCSCGRTFAGNVIVNQMRHGIGRACAGDYKYVIIEHGTRREFKLCLLAVTQMSKCVNCGDVTVAYEPDGEGYHWCKKCTVPVLTVGASPPDGSYVVKHITKWGPDNDTRVRHILRF